MALLFDDASAEDLSRTSALVTATPLTIAAWFFHDVAAGDQYVVTLERAAVGTHFFALAITSTHAVRAQLQGGGGAPSAVSTASGTINTWHHACGVWSADDARAAYLNGANKGTEATSVAPSGLDRTRIGGRDNAGIPIGYFSGRIADVGIWNVALDDAEVASLGKGFSPLLIRPQSLIAYYPLDRVSVNQSGLSLDRWKNHSDMTENNTPTLAEHPRIILPRSLTGTP